MSDYVLETEGVTYRYGKKCQPALSDVTVRVRRGVKTAIIGANGAGKSTLFGILNALYKPESGVVRYNGEPISYRRKSVTRMRTDVAVLFQNPDDMLFRPVVEQDVAFGPENLGLSKDEVERRVEEALFMVGMQDFRKSGIMRLSYGQRKRVAIAGVLAMRPKVLIMDEPTAGLDPQMASEVMELVEQLHREGTTVVMSSHDTDLTYAWADEIHVMQNGRCIYSGEPEPFYADKPSVYLAGLLPPKVFLMNEGLSSMRGTDPSPFPRTEAQLISKTVPPKAGTGTLHIMPVSAGADDKAVDAALASAGLSEASRGIYGKSARRAKDIANVGIEFFYGAPENCMIRCMEGKDTVLLCDPAMVDVAVCGVGFMERAGFGKMPVKVLPEVSG